MTFTMTNRWAASASVAGASLIIYSPLTFWLVDFIFLKKGYIYSRETGPSLLGLFVHTIVLFFAVFGLLSIAWACE